MTSQLLDTALACVRDGLFIIPLHTPTDGRCSCRKPECHSIGKHPRTPNGLSDAANDEQQVAHWWQKWPDANIGIVTGARSGIIVIDLDNGGGKNGEANFAALAESLGRVPNTKTTKTGRGKHLYFRHPGSSTRNSAGQLAPGVDVRADGGYVVAAGSRHANGTVYEMVNPGAPIFEMPVWLLDLVQGRSVGSGDGSLSTRSTAGTDGFFPEGSRNNSLYNLGCSLRGQLAMEHADILQRLMLYNETKCVPPLPEEEVRKVAQSACKHPAENGGKKSLARQELMPLYWYKKNVRQFNANLNIQRMTDYQLGWHTKLEVFAWQNAGVLPADDSTLWKLAGAKSRKAFARDSSLVLSEYLEKTLLGERVLVHHRMATDYADTLEEWLKKKAAGQANAERLRAAPSLPQRDHGHEAQTIQ